MGLGLVGPRVHGLVRVCGCVGLPANVCSGAREMDEVGLGGGTRTVGLGGWD